MAQQQRINFGGTTCKFHIYRGGVLGGEGHHDVAPSTAALLIGSGSAGGADDDPFALATDSLDPQEIARLAALAHQRPAPGGDAAAAADPQQQTGSKKQGKAQGAVEADPGFFIDEPTSSGEEEEEEEEAVVAQKQQEAEESAGEEQEQQQQEGQGQEEEQEDQQQQQDEEEQEEEEEEEGDEEDEDFIGLGLTAAEAAAAGLAPDSDSEDNGPEAQAARREGRAFGYQPPWVAGLRGMRSRTLRLHNEMVHFCKMLEPTMEESEARRDSVAEVAAVAASLWPDCQLEVFGSYATGLYTPASDVDCVVTGSGCKDAPAGLRALSRALQSRGLVTRVQEVLTARVPIIKFVMVSSSLAFDVSWELASGPAGAAEVRRMLEQWRALKPLALVLKVFLHQRELNEVFQGGIGSYALVTMIAASLKLHASRRAAAATGGGGGRGGAAARQGLAAPLESNLGVLLLDFFRLYGRELSFWDVGVSATGAGRFFNKHMRQGFQGVRPTEADKQLAVEDPLDDSNDVARSSFAWRTVRSVFDHAYQSLTAPIADSESLLGRIIHLKPVIAGRGLPVGWSVEAPGMRRGHGHGSGSARGGGGSGSGRDYRTPRRDSGRPQKRQQQQQHGGGGGSGSGHRNSITPRGGGGGGGGGGRSSDANGRNSSGGKRRREEDWGDERGGGAGGGGGKYQKQDNGGRRGRPSGGGGGGGGGSGSGHHHHHSSSGQHHHHSNSGGGQRYGGGHHGNSRSRHSTGSGGGGGGGHHGSGGSHSRHHHHRHSTGGGGGGGGHSRSKSSHTRFDSD